MIERIRSDELDFKSFDDLKKKLVDMIDNLDIWFDDCNTDYIQVIKRKGRYCLFYVDGELIYSTDDIDEYIAYLKKNYYSDINDYHFYIM